MSFPLRLIVGLGNPGAEHAQTRHNAGFWFADALAAKYGSPSPRSGWSLKRLLHADTAFRKESRFQGERTRIHVAGQAIEVFKPLTYMNRSGLAIRSLAITVQSALDYLAYANISTRGRRMGIATGSPQRSKPLEWQLFCTVRRQAQAGEEV